MATIPKKSKKKRMSDINPRIPSKVGIEKSEVKKLEEDLKKMDKEIKKFEEKQKEEFKIEEKKEEKPQKRFRLRKLSFKKFIIIGLSLAVVAGAVYLAMEFLPKVEIKVSTKKTDWNYVDSMTADKNVSGIDANQKQIPAEIFSGDKNFTFSFLATGKKTVQEKATGKITIYNAYSSASQKLVATTRFAAPDGKIFRLVKEVIVPGAEVVEGKIVPSNIEAEVAADQVGPKYNIDPVSKFTLPGFQGSPKYQGFYGESKEAMTGGFIGERAYPTDDDIKEAKAEALSELENSVETFLSLQIPPEFKLIDGSKQFNILKQEVNTKVDEKNNFTVFTEVKLTAIAFKESDLKNLMEETAKTSLGENFRITTYKLDYGAGRADFKQGKISFAVNFQGTFEEPLNIEDFRQKAAGKNEAELKALVASFSNIQKVTISFWPFWVNRAPENLERIKVEVE